MNVELSAMAGLAQRLLQPERVAIGEVERGRALRRVEAARNAGLLDHEQAAEQRERLARARTRGDVRQALGGAARVAEPVLRGVSVLWFLAVPVQFVIWALVSVIGFHWTEPWWLWTLVTGPFLIGPLWWLTEQAHDNSLRADTSSTYIGT